MIPTEVNVKSFHKSANYVDDIHETPDTLDIYITKVVIIQRNQATVPYATEWAGTRLVETAPENGATLRTCCWSHLKWTWNSNPTLLLTLSYLVRLETLLECFPPPPFFLLKIKWSSKLANCGFLEKSIFYVWNNNLAAEEDSVDILLSSVSSQSEELFLLRPKEMPFKKRHNGFKFIWPQLNPWGFPRNLKSAGQHSLSEG